MLSNLFRSIAGVWLVLGCLNGHAAENTAGQLAAGLVNPGYEEKPAWFKNSFLDIREDVREAHASNKRVLLYFYQDGCPYCAKLLRENLAMRDIERKLRVDFDVVAINMWGDREVVDFAGNEVTEKEFSAALRVMFTPTLLFLNESGNVVLRVNGYYPPHKFEAALDYVSARQETNMPFREYYAGLSTRPSSGKLHQQPEYLKPPYQLSRGERPGSKPLLVLFEQRRCTPCDELHLEVLRRPESRAQIERLDVALLDMWSRDPVVTPDGRAMRISEWTRELNIQYAPSLVFFDDTGQEVFRAEAYLKSFHLQSVMDYVASGAYREQPNFQRFIAGRADALEAQGIHVDLMD